MRTYLINAAVLGAFLSFTACSDAPNNADKMEQKVDKAMDDLRAGKEEMSSELRDLREKLVVEHARAEERLKDPDLTAEERSEWEAYKADVQMQLDRVDGNLNDVGSATNEMWDDVKAGTRRTVDDIGDWFDRQAEKIDRDRRRQGYGRTLMRWWCPAPRAGQLVAGRAHQRAARSIPISGSWQHR
ncbi:MAG TPA: hypothetical protein PLL57_02325 [Flavobacteriales bacterium]|nr:hypothetical protein [Flavobacteriales bacterium]